jgi:hypothetical protein
VAPPVPTITLTLWKPDAIVLLDWLRTADLSALPTPNPAHEQALVDLLLRLEETDLLALSPECKSRQRTKR